MKLAPKFDKGGQPRKLTEKEIAENKRKQQILLNNGYKAVKVNGNWGPWQESLWKELQKKTAVHATKNITQGLLRTVFPTYAAIQDGKKIAMKTLNPILKPVAHSINEYGKQPSSSSGQEEWWHDQTNTNKILIQEKATKEYKKMLGLKTNQNQKSFKEAWNERQELDKKALDWYFKNKVDPSLQKGYENRAKRTHAENAAAFALIGSSVSWLPFIGQPLGLLFGGADQVYDWAASVDEPSNSNTAHVYSNYAGDIVDKATDVIPGKMDDYVLDPASKALTILGNADDAASAGGNDIFEWTNNY